ncbi:hypothetical protein VIGAN_01306900, partial [Vigna angularis var. angularis]
HPLKSPHLYVTPSHSKPLVSPTSPSSGQHSTSRGALSSFMRMNTPSLSLSNPLLALKPTTSISPPKSLTSPNFSPRLVPSPNLTIDPSRISCSQNASSPSTILINIHHQPEV